MKRFALILQLITGFIFEVEAQPRQKSYQIIQETAHRSTDTLFLQARSVVLPKKYSDRSLITMSVYGYGTHAYGDAYNMEKINGQTGWSKPERILSLTREKREDGLIRTFGDITPDWHERTETVLATGKSFFSYAADTSYKVGNKRIDIEELQEIAYATYDPIQKQWSGLSTVKLPAKLENGDDFYCVNAGCTQRVDLPNGRVLLPVRYLKDKQYVTTVILCDYDGKKLSYLKHGSTFTVPEGRGLYEPSLTYHGGKYFITLRGDKSAYVAKSDDGLTFEPMKEWEFDDGKWLGSYNTQQHWISNSAGLFLVYTRKSDNNDHIFRHRAPLFIAKVDPKKLNVIRSTESILMPIPDSGGDLGNFGVTHINSSETWVTAPVTPKNLDSKDRLSEIKIARIYWTD